MGLASKLAAAQAGQANPASNPYGPPQTGYAPPQASYGGAAPPPSLQPGRPQSASAPYGAPPAQGAYGQQGQPGQPSSAPSYGQQSPQYGAPPGQDPYGQQKQQQQQQGGQQYGQAPQQSQYGQAPPQQQQYGAPQQGHGQGPPQSQQYGQPPQQSQYGQPPPQQHYGQPPQQQGGGAGGVDAGTILNVLRQCVQEQKIAAFYPQGSLEQLSQRISSSGALQRISADWRMPLEISMDLCRLALFDTVLLCDDSGSMAFEEQGSRIEDLKMLVSKVAFAAGLFDQDGIQVRFLNSRTEGNNIANEQAAMALVSQIKFSGLTPLGTELKKKILEPLIVGPARQGRLQKPVLVIIVTDGEPGGEDRFKIVKVISEAKSELGKTRYGSDAMSFQLAQVGNDQKARAFLEEIDSHPLIGGLVDTTSNYENEADDMAKANPPVDLTPELWLVKLLLGGIDDSYDSKDEK